MKFLTVIALATTISSPAQAAAYLIEGTGVVTRRAALTNGTPVPVPVGSIAISDPLNFSFSFDAGNAELQSLFDANPAINIYYLPLLSFSMSVGGYSYTPTFQYVGNASLQMWDNYSSGTDAQSFSFNGRGGNALPFAHQAGRMTESFTLNAFDNTGTARDTDLISELVPYTSFGARNFSWLQLNLDTQESVHLNGTFTATLTEIPEPSSAAVSLMGMGLVAIARRRRRC